MTNIYSYGNSPAITSMFDSSKGSFSNRAHCTADRAGNTLSGTLEIGALGAATYGGYKAISKVSASNASALTALSEKVTKLLRNGAALYKKTEKWINADFKNATGITKFAGKALSKIADVTATVLKKTAGLSGKQKALAALALVATAAFLHIERKHAYKEGQIDQKYTDKAKIEDAKNNLFNI